MASVVRRVETEALQLPSRARARLAERLISSLDEESDADAEGAWMLEAERRLNEMRTGKVKGRPAAAVFRRARAALR
jgi:putative addiction module component (TIGR02574 family)